MDWYEIERADYLQNTILCICCGEKRVEKSKNRDICDLCQGMEDLLSLGEPSIISKNSK